jgi:hypothetical protein
MREKTLKNGSESLSKRVEFSVTTSWLTTGTMKESEQAHIVAEISVG